MINRDCYLKQHKTVEYLGCYLDSDLNGESMALRVLKKINTKLNHSYFLDFFLFQISFFFPCSSGLMVNVKIMFYIKTSLYLL